MHRLLRSVFYFAVSTKVHTIAEGGVVCVSHVDAHAGRLIIWRFWHGRAVYERAEWHVSVIMGVGECVHVGVGLRVNCTIDSACGSVFCGAGGVYRYGWEAALIIPALVTVAYSLVMVCGNFLHPLINKTPPQSAF
jgi:hypothetical protein